MVPLKKRVLRVSYFRINLNNYWKKEREKTSAWWNRANARERDKYHFFFLLSSALMSWTGAAGTLNHHSLTRLSNRSLLAFLHPTSLVNHSTNAIVIKYFTGTTAKITATITSDIADVSVAWKHTTEKETRELLCYPQRPFYLKHHHVSITFYLRKNCERNGSYFEETNVNGLN